MLITIVSATPFEIQPLVDYLAAQGEKVDNNLFQYKSAKIRILITGVGMTLTAFQLGSYLAKERPDLLVNAGVAGALNTKLNLGDVVHVISDCFGDLGAEEKDGSFINIHQLGLIDKNDAPFENGQLINKAAQEYEFLPKVSGVTVNLVHGYENSIEAFKANYEQDVETMEGAAVSFACLQSEIPFLAIRSISNYVEPRNRDAWELGLSINQLNEILQQILENFVQQN